MLLPIEASRIVVHEVDDPNALLGVIDGALIAPRSPASLRALIHFPGGSTRSS